MTIEEEITIRTSTKDTEVAVAAAEEGEAAVVLVDTTIHKEGLTMIKMVALPMATMGEVAVAVGIMGKVEDTTIQGTMHNINNNRRIHQLPQELLMNNNNKSNNILNNIITIIIIITAAVVVVAEVGEGDTMREPVVEGIMGGGKLGSVTGNACGCVCSYSLTYILFASLRP